MAAERISRLPRGHHEQAAVQVGQIVNAAISRAMHRLERRVRAPAIERGVVAGTRHADRSERSEDRNAANHRMSERRLMRLTPSPRRRIVTETQAQVAHGLVQRIPQHWSTIAVTPMCSSRGQHRRDEVGNRRTHAGRQTGMVQHGVVERLHPRVEDQRCGRLHRCRSVPASQQIMRLFTRAGDPWNRHQSWQHLSGERVDDVDLHRSEVRKRLPV